MPGSVQTFPFVLPYYYRYLIIISPQPVAGPSQHLFLGVRERNDVVRVLQYSDIDEIQFISIYLLIWLPKFLVKFPIKSIHLAEYQQQLFRRENHFIKALRE